METTHREPVLSGFDNEAERERPFPGDDRALAERGPGTQVGAYDPGDDAGAGLDDMSMEEQVTPFLRILQSNSPQLKEGNPEYVEGARGGMLFDTATQDAYPALVKAGEVTGVPFQICERERLFGIWTPRDLDGGFHGTLAPDSEIIIEALRKYRDRFHLPRFRKESGWTSKGKPCDPTTFDGQEVEFIETINYYVQYAPAGMPLEAGTVRRAILRFTSTSLSVATNTNSRMKSWLFRDPRSGQMRTPAIFTWRWRLRTVPQSNASGDWYNYRIDLEPATAKPPFDTLAMIPRTDPLFALGREFYELAHSGKVKVDHGAAGGVGGDEIPGDF